MLMAEWHLSENRPDQAQQILSGEPPFMNRAMLDAFCFLYQIFSHRDTEARDALYDAWWNSEMRKARAQPTALDWHSGQVRKIMRSMLHQTISKKELCSQDFAWAFFQRRRAMIIIVNG
jgi:hypothetical protein